LEKKNGPANRTAKRVEFLFAALAADGGYGKGKSHRLSEDSTNVRTRERGVICHSQNQLKTLRARKQISVAVIEVIE